MHQQPPKTPLFASTSRANASQVDSSRASIRYPEPTGPAYPQGFGRRRVSAPLQHDRELGMDRRRVLSTRTGEGVSPPPGLVVATGASGLEAHMAPSAERVERPRRGEHVH